MISDDQDGLGAIRGAIVAIVLLLIALLVYLALSSLLFMPDREAPSRRVSGPSPYSWRVPPAR